MTAYGDIILEHFRRPRNRGPLAGATLSHEGFNPLCGDRLRFAVALDGGVVRDARFVGDACAIAVAAASLLTELLRGRRLGDLERIADVELLSALGGEIPAGRHGCALLPLEVLREAVRAHRAGFLSIIVLAAGESRRFGAPKLLAELAGAPLLQHTVACLAAAHADEMLVVAPRDATRIRAALAGERVRIVECDDGRAEMSASLRAGLRALDPRATRILVALGDQPLVPERVLQRLLNPAADPRPITVPVYGGTRGNPVVFTAALLPELLAITGDRGAREVIARDPSRVREVTVAEEPPVDVDTPADLARLRSGIAGPGCAETGQDPASEAVSQRPAPAADPTRA